MRKLLDTIIFETATKIYEKYDLIIIQKYIS